MPRRNYARCDRLSVASCAPFVVVTEGVVLVMAVFGLWLGRGLGQDTLVAAYSACECWCDISDLLALRKSHR